MNHLGMVKHPQPNYWTSVDFKHLKAFKNYSIELKFPVGIKNFRSPPEHSSISISYLNVFLSNIVEAAFPIQIDLKLNFRCQSSSPILEVESAFGIAYIIYIRDSVTIKDAYL